MGILREKIALRLHTRDRSIIKILCETSPINVSWEELTETQRDMKGLEIK